MRPIPEQRVSITLEIDSDGGTLLREFYTCTNPDCPAPTHEDIARNPVDGIVILQKWIDQLMIFAASQGST